MKLANISFFIIFTFIPSSTSKIDGRVKRESSDHCKERYTKQLSAFGITKDEEKRELTAHELRSQPLLQSLYSYCDEKPKPSEESNKFNCDEALMEMILFLLHRWEWKSLILIADQDVNDLILSLSHSAIASVVIRIDQTSTFETDFHYHIEENGIKHILLRCKHSNIKLITQTALKLNLFDRQFTWISIDDSDLHGWSHLNDTFEFFQQERQMYSISKTSGSDQSLYELTRAIETKSSHRTAGKRFVGNYSKQQGLFLSEPFDTMFPLLKGYEVKVATFNDSFFMEVFKDDNGTITTRGLISEILKIVQEQLGIRVKYIIREDEIYGSLVNGSWNGVVGMVHRKEVDVGALALFRTPERDKVVSYSPYLMKSSRVIFIRDPNAQGKHSILYTLFLRPFHSSVWYLIIVTWLTMSIIMGIAYTFSPIENRFRFTKKMSVYHLTYGFWCGLLQQGIPMGNMRAPSCTIILLVFMLFSVLIYTSYTSVLVSFFTISKVDLPFTGLEDIIKDGSYAIGTIRHTSLEETLKQAQDSIYKKAWELISKDLQRNLVSNVQDAVARVKKEKFVLLYDWTSLQPFMEDDCSLTFLPNRYMIQGVHIIFQKNSPWREIFSWYISHLREAGILSRLERDYFGDQRECESKHQSKAVVTVHHVIGVIIALMVGFVGSAVCFCLECTFNKRRKHRGFLNYTNCLRSHRMIIRKKRWRF